MFAKLTTAILTTAILLAACGAPDEDTAAIDAPSVDTPSVDAPSVDAPAVDISSVETAPSPLPALPTTVAYNGTYAMDGTSCDVMAGTMTITPASVRLSETVCDIQSLDPINASSMSFILTGCLAEGTAAADRIATVSQNADGSIRVANWSDQTFDFNVRK